MRRASALLAGFVLVAGAALTSASAADSGVGRWAIGGLSDDRTRVQLRLEYAERSDGSNWTSMWSNDVPIAEAGLSADRLRAPIGPVTFAIQREPGMFSCTGSAGEGSGAGQFTYAPNPRFDDALAARGMGRPTLRQSLQLALASVTSSYVDEVRAMSKTATTADVIRLVEHGAGPHYVADLAALGYKPGSLEQIVRLRDHGVTAPFIRAVQSAGFRNLSADDLVRLRDHGVSERFLTDMRGAGYTNVTAEQLIGVRDHGVTPRYIADLAAAGYKNLSLEDLVALRDHGVSAAFVGRLKAHGYGNIPVRDVIRLHDAGI